MRIFVQVWCEVDPTLNVRIDRSSGSAIADEGDELYRVSALGQSGVLAALSVLGASVAAFALGRTHMAALRRAIALGARRGFEVSSSARFADDMSLPALAEWLRPQADLVIADQRAGLIAGHLGWSHLAGVAEVEMHEGELRAMRLLGRGDRDLVIAQLPAVLRLQGESPPRVYVSRARLAAARNSAIDSVSLAAAQSTAVTSGPLETVRPRTKLPPLAPTARSASSRLQALLRGPADAVRPATGAKVKTATESKDAMAEEFVRYLRHHQLLPNE